MDSFSLFDGKGNYTLDDIIEHFQDGYQRCGIGTALDYSVGGMFYKINDSVKQKIIEMAPGHVLDYAGNYVGSDEVQLMYLRDETGNLVLHVKIGIWTLYKLKHEYFVDTSYVYNFLDFSSNCSLDDPDDAFDVLKGCLSKGPKLSVSNVEKTTDKSQSGVEHALNTSYHGIFTPKDYEKVVNLDPSNGSVSRLTGIKAIHLSEPTLSDKDEVIKRANEHDMIVTKHVNMSRYMYYLGFYDVARKPSNYFGFEINPYSCENKGSGRIISVVGVNHGLYWGHDVLYERRGMKINHFFNASPNYFRYKTRYVVPFFQSYNRRFAHDITDAYIFYSSDPFLDCFNHIVPTSGKKEIFPIGLKPLYDYKDIEVVKLRYKDRDVEVKFRVIDGMRVDLDCALCYDSRYALYYQCLDILKQKPPDFSKLKATRYEHPISGDIYDRAKDGCLLQDGFGFVDLCDRKQIVTHDVNRLAFYKSNGKHYPITKDDIFLPDRSGKYRHFRLILQSGGDYVTVRGVVPGAPFGYVINAKDVSPVPKKHYFSVIKGNRDSCEFFQELQDYYSNCVWFKSFKYVYQDLVSYKDVGQVKFSTELKICGDVIPEPGGLRLDEL